MSVLYCVFVGYLSVFADHFCFVMACMLIMRVMT